MHGLPKLLVVYWLELSIVVRVTVRARDREKIFDCFFFLFHCLKLTNTFVLPSWSGVWSDSYLGGARVNQWTWYRKHVTIVTSVLGVL